MKNILKQNLSWEQRYINEVKRAKKNADCKNKICKNKQTAYKEIRNDFKRKCILCKVDSPLLNSNFNAFLDIIYINYMQNCSLIIFYDVMSQTLDNSVWECFLNNEHLLEQDKIINNFNKVLDFFVASDLVDSLNTDNIIDFKSYSKR